MLSRIMLDISPRKIPEVYQKFILGGCSFYSVLPCFYKHGEHGFGFCRTFSIFYSVLGWYDNIMLFLIFWQTLFWEGKLWCAQNWYIAFKIDLKYSLECYGKFLLVDVQIHNIIFQFCSVFEQMFTILKFFSTF